MKRYWVCSLLGHKDSDPEAIYDPFVCKRCGDSDYDNHYDDDFDPWHIRLYYRMKWRAKNKRDRFVGWFRRCPDCGRRFGRHDESVDHLPF